MRFSNQTNLNQISHTSFNRKIFDQTNLNQISHTSFNREIFDQTNLNHEIFNHEL